MGIFGEERVYPSQVPGPEEIFGEKASCCELVIKMKLASKEEGEGAEMYKKMAKSLNPLKDNTARFFQSVLEDMSKDEERHKRYLEAISEILGDFCKCK